MLSPWRKAADILLSDGERHSEEEVIGVMMDAVPPHKAVRRRRQTARYQGKYYGYKPTIETNDVVSEIASGARMIARYTLVNALNYGTWSRSDGYVWTNKK